MYQLVYRSLLAMTLSWVVSVAVAQTQPPPNSPKNRGGAMATSRPVSPSARMVVPGSHLVYLGEVTKACDLDEGQQTQVRGLLSAADEDFVKLRAELRPPPEISQKMNDLTKQMLAAKQQGDEAKLAELRQQRIDIAKGFTIRRDEMVEKMKARDGELHAALAAVMRPDQKERFEAFWTEQEQFQQQANPGSSGRVRSPRALQAAVDRIADLTPDQKAGIEAAFRAHQEAARAAAGHTPEIEAAVKKLYADVTALLTDPQKQRIERELQPAAAPAAGEPAKAGDGSGAAPPAPPAVGDTASGGAQPGTEQPPKPVNP